MTYFYLLSSINPYNFQIFQLIYEQEKPSYFHNKTLNANIISVFSLSKIFFETGNSMPSQSRSLTTLLSAFVIFSGCIFNGFKCLIWHQNKYLLSLFLLLIKPLTFWPVRRNGWVFVYKLSGYGFESRCCHLNFRYGACFEWDVPWHSGKLPSVYSLWNSYVTR